MADSLGDQGDGYLFLCALPIGVLTRGNHARGHVSFAQSSLERLCVS